MTVQRFRVFLTAYVLATLAAVAASFIPGGYSDELRRVYERDRPGSSTRLLPLWSLVLRWQ